MRQIQIWLLAVLVCQWQFAGISANWQPEERANQPWRLHQLTADAGLDGRNIFNIAFQPDPTNRAVYRVWIATSDGLREYDGFDWRRHGVEDGLPSAFVRCVCVTREGEVWVGTDRGAGVYLGGRFDSKGSETGLAGPNVRRIKEDRDGTLWFCSDSWPNDQRRGGVSSYAGGRWRAFRESDGLPSEYVVDFLGTTDGRAYVATLAGLAFRGENRWKAVTGLLPGQSRRWSGAALAESPVHGVMCSTGHELLVEDQGDWTVVVKDAESDHGICVTADGAVLSTTRVLSGSRAFVEFATNRWERVSAEFEAPHDYVEDLQEAPDGSVWAVGFDTLVRWRRKGTTWREFVGIPSPAFVDGAGRIWFAESRSELDGPRVPVRLDGDRWERLDDAEDELVLGPRGEVWGVTSNRVTHWTADGRTRWRGEEVGLARLDAGRPDGTSRFWLHGTSAAGESELRMFEGGRWRDRPIGELGRWPSLRLMGGGRDGVWLLLEPTNQHSAVLARVGVGTLQWVEIPRTNLGLFRLNMREDREGRLWVFGDGGAWRLDDFSREGWKEVTGLPGRTVFALEQRGSELWLGCNGATGGTNGLVKREGDRQTFFPAETLFNMSQAHDGTLLAGGPAKFVLVPNEPDAEPMTLSVPTAELVIGAIRDHQGRDWLGTGDQVYSFTPDDVPPDTRIIDRTMTNVFQGTDWSVTVTAIERYLPAGFRKDSRYSWRIDGSGWSPFRQGEVLILPTRNLAGGSHQLEVRAQDTAMEIDPTPSTLAFRVIPVPIQSRPWFVPSLILLAVAFGALSFVTWRARQGMSAYARVLELKVTERTAQLERDIEHRKQAEARLRESEQRYGDLVRLSPDAIFINQDNRISFINFAGLQLLRASTPEQVVGRAALDFFSPSNHEMIKERVRFLRHEPGIAPPVEEELVALDGTRIPVEVSAASYFSQGELVIQVVCRDITSRKKADQEQKILAAQLHQAQKMEAVGTLAGGIAHDFNNILGAILGNLELARMDVGRTHPASESLDEIGRAAQRARSVVQQILAFSRPNLPEQRPIDLGPVIQETLRFLRATLPSGVELQVGIESGVPVVVADPTQISQVLVNLSTNAWHALENRPGSIRVRLEPADVGSQGLPRLDGVPPGRYAKISVADSGIGMDSMTRQRIFEPFFTTKEPGKGTGLGLAVVHGIVQGHGGHIRVQSTPGSGTVFEVYLPAALDAPVPVSSETGASLQGQGRRVLYLDDEAALVRQMARLIRRMGFEAEAFDRIEAAREAFLKRPEAFDLVITDMNMPGGSGLEFAGEVLRARPGIAVVLTTGYITEELRESARALGVRRILAKPSTFAELGQAIFDALAHPKA